MLFTVCGPLVCPVRDTFILYKQLKCPTLFKEPWLETGLSCFLRSSNDFDTAEEQLCILLAQIGNSVVQNPCAATKRHPYMAPNKMSIVECC